jgi:lactoylglutathione lyase
MINRMICTGVWVNDGEKALDFWANKLGFTVLQDKTVGEGGRFLQVMPQGGGTALNVATISPWATNAQVGVETPIVWATDDIDATYEALRAKGVQFSQPPTQQFWGGFQATFNDPDGNSYKLMKA